MDTCVEKQPSRTRAGHAKERSLSTFIRICRYVGPHRRRLIVGAICMLISLATTLAIPWLLKEVIDVAIGGRRRTFLVEAGVAIVIFSIVRGLSAYGQTYQGQTISQLVAYDMRNQLYEKLQNLSFAFHDNSETGQLMSRATVDVEAVRQFLAMGMLRIISSVLLAIGVAILLLSMNVLLAVILFLSLPLIGYLAVRVSRQLRPTWLRVQQQTGALGTLMQESLTGVRVVKSFGREEYESDKFDRANQAVRESSLRANRLAAVNQPTLTLVLNMVTAAIIWVGGALVMRHNLTLGVLVAFTQYAALLAMPVRMLGFITNLISRSISAAQRVFEILDTESAVEERPHARELKSVLGHVRFDNVDFGYAERSPVLHGMVIDAQPGQTIALLGPTGSGKSTIVHLLPRFYDATSGAITIDGQDIRDLTLSSLRKHIGVVLQDVFLFSASIADNIAYGVPGATRQKIEAAARAACIHDFIHGLPQGYDSWVGERGITLSGGQKQRVAIARTLLRDPRILVLDDSTSSVDMETEFLIQQALTRVMEGRTTFVVAHRLRTVLATDHIVVLDNGHIVQRGRHEDLVAIPGPYRDIYDLQLREQHEAGPKPASANVDEAAR